MSISIQEQHNRALDALIEMKTICERHGITYYLLAGSVLGAVRHKGFIPWDDDIDVGIKYDDIASLETYLEQELSYKYRYVSYSIDQEFPRLHGKILCEGRTCVDVFPLVRAADNIIVRKIQWNVKSFAKKLFYRKCNYIDKSENIKLVKIATIIAPFFSKNRIIKMYEWSCSLCNYKVTKDWINISSVYSMNKETIPSTYLEKPSNLLFENNIFTGVGEPDMYLKNLYGDYMQLPPLEKRVSGHEEIFTSYI